MGNKSKRPRPEKRRPPQQLPDALDLDFTEVEEGAEQAEPARELLFKYKGEEYYMEAPEPIILMEIMEAASERSDIGAMGFMVKKAVGDKNWRVLKSIPGLTNEELGQVFDRAMTFTMGQMGDLGN